MTTSSEFADASVPTSVANAHGGSVGVVHTQFMDFDEPLHLSSGHTLPAYRLAIETYGELNADASNAVLI